MPSIREVYFSSIKELKNQNQEIEVRILLSHINSIKSMTDYYLSLDKEMQNYEEYKMLFKKYLNGEPIAYLINEAEFYGDKFYVDENVLIPRNDSEEVVEFALESIKKTFGEKSITIADVCTGSGCLGIELAKHSNCKKVYLTDISDRALEVAKKNASNLLKSNYEILEGDSLKPLEKHLSEIDVLISNPPYILNKENVDDSVLKYEPHLALFTSNSLDVYRSILESVSKHQNSIKIIVFELGDEIKDLLEKLIKETLPNESYEFRKDMNGKNRMVGIIL